VTRDVTEIDQFSRAGAHPVDRLGGALEVARI
jgi:hypothetical protein